MTANSKTDKVAPSTEGAAFDITNRTRSTPPALPYSQMKDHVLGKDYSLSLVFAGETTSRQLNLRTRGKDSPASVLSFPLSERSGEIIICPSVVRRRVRDFESDFTNLIAYHFIHGLLHLKGLEHGDTMERKERETMKKFGLVPLSSAS